MCDCGSQVHFRNFPFPCRDVGRRSGVCPQHSRVRWKWVVVVGGGVGGVEELWSS